MYLKILISALLLALLFACNKKESTPNAPEGTPNSTENPTTATTEIAAKDSTAISTKRPAQKNQLRSYLHSAAKKPQVFTINNAQASIVKGKENTKITFPANVFVSQRTGKSATGNITIKLTEYYQLPDILMARLGTTSDGKLLETGGMFYIEAFSEGEKLALQKGKSYEVEFATPSTKPDMEIFNGSWQNNRINWSLENEAVNLTKNYITAELTSQPEFPGGQKKFYEFIQNNVELMEDDISGTIYAAFVVDRTGKVANARIHRGLSKNQDQAVLDAIAKLPVFKPGMRNGVAVNTQLSLPVKITASERENGDYIAPSQPVSKKRKEVTLSTAYAFRASGLGWINCDRFVNSAEQVQYAVTVDQPQDAMAFLVFAEIKSAVQGFPEKGRMVFTGIPASKNATLVVLKYENEKLHLAVRETKTVAKIDTGLEFRAVTQEEFNTEMKKIKWKA